MRYFLILSFISSIFATKPFNELGFVDMARVDPEPVLNVQLWRKKEMLCWKEEKAAMATKKGVICTDCDFDTFMNEFTTENTKEGFRHRDCCIHRNHKVCVMMALQYFRLCADNTTIDHMNTACNITNV